MSDTATVLGGGPLRGEAHVPGDKSISHRGLIFGALAEGRSRVRGLSSGDDVLRTREALRALGARFDGEAIEGGRDRLREADDPIDVGNSGTGMRLLAGVLASLPFFSVLIGDASVHRRPMARITEPLSRMGARIDGRDGASLAPLAIRGGRLHGIDHTSAVASAQVKSAILLAGLVAEGETIVREPTESRPHTEELLGLAGVRTERSEHNGMHVVRLRAAELSPFELEVPGDPSQAAFLVVAASIVAGSEILIKNVYVGPARSGFIPILSRMGADIEVIARDATTADLLVRHAPLHATEIGGSEVADALDELPVLAVAAAFAEGTTTIRDAAELRVKESDRIETMASELEAIGVRVEVLDDGLVVHGGRPSPSGRVSSHGDHRVAMALAVAALPGSDELRIDGVGVVGTSWPGFFEELESLRCP